MHLSTSHRNDISGTALALIVDFGNVKANDTKAYHHNTSRKQLDDDNGGKSGQGAAVAPVVLEDWLKSVLAGKVTLTVGN